MTLKAFQSLYFAIGIVDDSIFCCYTICWIRIELYLNPGFDLLCPIFHHLNTLKMAFLYKAKEKSTHKLWSFCWQAYLNRKGEADRQIVVHLFMSVCDIFYSIPHLLFSLTTWGDSVNFVIVTRTYLDKYKLLFRKLPSHIQFF